MSYWLSLLPSLVVTAVPVALALISGSTCTVKFDVAKGGVMVMKVEQGPAIKAGIRPGDILLSINNTDIQDPHQFIEVAKKLPANKPIPVLVQRGGSAQFLALEIKE